MHEIIYADEALVVANKPADMLSVPGRGEDKQDCLWRRVQADFPTARIVHRLDYATSGIIVLALTLESQRNISKSFQERLTNKRYQAIIGGEPNDKEGSIELPLRCDWENRPLQIVDFEQGKNALTHWKVISSEELGTRVELDRLLLHAEFLAFPHPDTGEEISFNCPTPF